MIQNQQRTAEPRHKRNLIFGVIDPLAPYTNPSLLLTIARQLLAATPWETALDSDSEIALGPAEPTQCKYER